MEDDVAVLRGALADVEARAGDLPWSKERRWRVTTHVGVQGGLPAVDLHDLSVRLAVLATERALRLLPELDSGDIVLITGRGRGSGGVSRLRRAVLDRARAIAADAGWRAAPDGPGRVRVVSDPSKASPALGPVFWLVVALVVAGMIAALAGCASPPEPDGGPPERFALPVDERDRFTGVIGVDHDPEDHGDSVLGGVICTAYDGSPFPACYDGHDGSDFMLAGGFAGMDAGSPAVLAAADGVVIATEDGHYDRCHVEGTAVSCDGHPIIANHVIVEHPSGVRTRYWHLAEGSVTVAVGEVVLCGDVLGLVGSSGNSSAPHLHFEVNDADGGVIDPFAGPESQPESWWTRQDAGDGLPGGRCREASSP